MYTYNYLGLSAYKIASPKALPEGNVTIRYEFAYEGGGLAKAARYNLVNGEKVAEGRIDRTQPMSSPPTKARTLGWMARRR